MQPAELLDRVKDGDRRALARAITHVENNTKRGQTLLDHLDYAQFDTHIIGITGPPGSGKSTLVDLMISRYREENKTIGVLAVDPTSPFSGGAILGDRIRMLTKSTDEHVYIRSLASRGRLGGLSPHTYDVLLLMQHAGFDKIIVETVGAGQSEIDIVRNADTTCVMTVPGLGDDIQVIKAGIMEIADIFVVNKSDLSGTKQIMVQIKNMLDLVPTRSSWMPSIIQTSALREEGISELVDAIASHFEYLNQDNRIKKIRREQLEFEIRNKFHHKINEYLDKVETSMMEDILDKLIIGELNLSSTLRKMEKLVFSIQSNN